MVNFLSQKIIGRITNFRTGLRTQQPKVCLIEFKNLNASSAGKLVGQKVVWINGKNKFTGKILGLHGRNGCVKVKFPHPVPSQAIGTTVELVG